MKELDMVRREKVILGVRESETLSLSLPPSHPPFLQALLVHVGEEHSVDAAYINNKLGNPLLLRTYVHTYATYCCTHIIIMRIKGGRTWILCGSKGMCRSGLRG